MSGGRKFRARLIGGTALAVVMLGGAAAAAEPVKFDIAPQSLTAALNEFGVQSNHAVLFTTDLTNAKLTQGVAKEAEPEIALAQMLDGTGLSFRRSGDAFLIVRADAPQGGSASGEGAGTVEALIVTAQKREEDIQDVPIAISAFTQENLERSQIASGPDLMTQVPNMTFTKTNFSSYSIQLRGIGTQAISATTDAAVAVAFNNTPFIRNRFFEQEFYDLQRVEVLRGPQGTLYGRNATAGVVNLISQKPKFVYEAKLSADVSNYSSTRLEGMLNIPLAEDKVALRLAGAWTKREGFTTNEITATPIDGRDLWSTRLSLRVAPTDGIDVNLIWEHFKEDDDRLRSGKQLCHQDDRTEYAGNVIHEITGYSNIFSQGCLPASLYSPDSFEAPNGYSLPYYLPLGALSLPVVPQFNPYASLVQSSDLRVIESTLTPEYKATSDIVELQFNADLTDSLTLASETAYSFDRIFSFEDYNRFNTARGAFKNEDFSNLQRPGVIMPGEFGGIFCDPQLGCADRVVAGDVSTARSRQFSQELRLSSNFEGPFNFSLGANFLRYDTEDKYYVFINTLSMFAANYGYSVPQNLPPYVAGVTDNHECMPEGGVLPDPRKPQVLSGCIYMDPNPISNLNDLGHNYFLSRNPYKLISYAVFGEAYYDIAENLKVTAGLRWTVDKKEAPRIPSWVVASDTLGYSVLAVEEQEWREPTGRLTIDWKPDLAFTDETMLYASYAHGYKAGGSNPPPSGIVSWGLAGGLSQGDDNLGGALVEQSAVKPKIFDPEFVDAFEIGAKNTLLDGRITLNAAAFYYDYQGYQVSQIIDRSAVNYNFDSKVWGVEIEADWHPLENLRFGFKGGYENTRVADGERAIDIMERNAGHGPNSDDPWVVVRPFPSYPSNCVLPLYTVSDPSTQQMLLGPGLFSNGRQGPCEFAYALGLDPVSLDTYVPNPTTGFLGSPLWPGYPGFNPELDYGANHGEGFFKELGGNELPNAPHFTATLTADYTLPLPNDWLATLHTDLYYQSEAWTRVFNMEGYDKLKAFTNVNLAAIFTNEEAGWKVMAYVKNVFDKDNITGAFLNSDDSGLTTNVFLVEPRLYGLRVTKDFSGGPWWTGANPNHTGPYPLTVGLGGSLLKHDAPYQAIESAGGFTGAVDPANFQNLDMDRGEGGDVKLTWQQAGSPWSLSGAYRWGKAKVVNKIDAREEAESRCIIGPPYQDACQTKYEAGYTTYYSVHNWLRGEVRHHDEHELIDFEVGHDVGLGFGLESRLSGGLRYADFKSQTQLDVTGTPDADMPDEWAIFKYSDKHFYDTDITMDREFKGLGPTLTWDASKTLWGDEASGRLNLDLSLSGGVLFGKQKVQVSGGETSVYYEYVLRFREPFLPQDPTTLTPAAQDRTKSVTVPTYAGALGLSYDVGRMKIGTGYRWERFSNVLDGGYAEHKSFDRTLDGPYFKIAVGFGG